MTPTAVAAPEGDMRLKHHSFNRLLLVGVLSVGVLLGVAPNALAAAPSVTIEAATSVGETTATLQATVNPQGSDAQYNFLLYATEPGESQPCETQRERTAEGHAGSGTKPVKVSAAVAELDPGTTYCYKIVAYRGEEEEAEEEVSSAEASFTTAGKPPPPPPGPTVTTGNVSALGGHTATLEGTVNPNGSNTEYYFEWGESNSYGSYAPAGPPGTPVGAGESAVPVSAKLTGLTIGSTYHYRLVAHSTAGYGYGSDKTFTTPSFRPAAVLLPNGSEDVFFRGENGAIWEATSTSVIELGGKAAGNPAAVALSNGEQDVYFAGTNGAIWRFYFNPVTKGWVLSEVGGVSAGDPTVAAGAPYSVFFRQQEGCQQCIYQSYLSGSTWQTRSLGGNSQSDPTAVATPTGGEQVFWVESGAQGVIAEWYASTPTGEYHYTPVGGTATGEKPAVVMYPSGKESVYFRAREGCILCEDQLYWSGSSWSTQWGSGQLGGGPTALPESETSQRSYWRGTDSAIWYNYGEPANYPFNPVRIGGSTAGDLAEVLNPTATASTSLYYQEKTGGLIDLYYEGLVWHFKQLCAWPCGEQGPQPPKVTSVSPASGSGTGGTSVAISGGAFTGATEVTFGATNATSFTVNSASSITATAPAGVGVVNVSVTTALGTSTITPADQFTYTPYSTTSRPSAVLAPDGSEDVYFRGENGAIWESTSYGAIKELGGQAVGSPAAVALPSGEQDVYYLGTNGSIWRWYLNPATQVWSSSQVGGVTASEPAVAPQNPYMVFFRQGEGCQACIYEASLSGSTWNVQSLGGSSQSAPTAVATASGAEQVFWVESGSGGVSEWYTTAPGGEWHYNRIGGTPAAEKMTVALHADNTESVLFRAREGCINCIDQLYWNHVKWETQWIGGEAAGPPVTADEGPTYASVYWRSGKNELWDLYGNPTYPGSTWRFNNFGGDMGSNPAEVHNANASVSTSLYYVDQTGGLTDEYMQNGEWHTKQICTWPCAARGPKPATSTTPPQLSTNTVRQGVALTTTNGSWRGEPTITYAYQWQDCNSAGGHCARITGATSSSYTPVAADVGHTLRVVVTATNGGGHAEASSLASGVLPAVTQPANEVAGTEAMLHGTVDPQGHETKYYFEYGTTNAYGAKTAEGSAGAGTSNVEKSARLTGLILATTYHFRFVATNSSGTFDGADQTFMTTAMLKWGGVQQTPEPTGATKGSLQAISCASATACIATGTYGNTAGSEFPLAEGWNGTSWSLQELPSPTGATKADLEAVSCSSATACTATGYFWNSGENTAPLAERWNGTKWSVQEPPSPSGQNGIYLKGVSCATTTSCVAAGWFYNSVAGKILPLAETWNGTAWAIQEPPPPVGISYSYLEDVSCTSATACVAVGYFVNAAKTASLPLVETWNGTTWALREPPLPTGSTTAYLEGVSCTSSTACMAAGRFRTSANKFVPLAEKWNGTTWSAQEPPAPTGATGSDLQGISCSSATACTAVEGFTNSSGVQVLLAESWKGVSWTIQEPPSPTGAKAAYLHGVSCSLAGGCVAAGNFTNSAGVESPFAETAR